MESLRVLPAPVVNVIMVLWQQRHGAHPDHDGKYDDEFCKPSLSAGLNRLFQITGFLFQSVQERRPSIHVVCILFGCTALKSEWKSCGSAADRADREQFLFVHAAP